MRVFMLFSCLFAIDSAQENNVCKSYWDYWTISKNPNCWHNPDVDSTPFAMVTRNGYPFEVFEVTTEDGHILSLFRIPHNFYNADEKGQKQPIYLHHGTFSTSSVWIDKGPRSLAYRLSEKGFDVWMANTRGSAYSMGHEKYNVNDPQYWNYSLHEIAVYDVSANLNFIKKTTGFKAVYVGFSMGTTISYIYSIDKKEEALNNLKGIISIAPVAYMTSLKAPYKYLAPISNFLESAFEFINLNGLFYTDFPRKVTRFMCNPYPFSKLCEVAPILVFGANFEKLLPQEIPVMYSYSPSGSSLKTQLHFAQISIDTNRFPRYDYGSEINEKTYGSAIPPEYDLNQVPFCVHLLYGTEDAITDYEDVLLLHKNLKCSTMDVIALNDDPGYNHIDFLYAKDVQEKLYPILFEKIDLILKDPKEADLE